MAFGHHWEWRGFGPVEHPVTGELAGLPLQYAKPQDVVDRYLWFPGCALNLKLRFGDFKIKRLLQKLPGGIEEWLEDEAENHAFPLAPGVVEDVARALGIPEARPEGPIDSGEDLVACLVGEIPGLRVLRVVKTRWAHVLPDRPDVLVERAEIHAPEDVLSVSVECAERETLEYAMECLGLPDTLASMSYLEALAVWGAGKRVLGA